MGRNARNWLPMVQPAPSSRREVAHEHATVPFKKQAWEREATVPRAVAAQRRQAAVRTYKPFPSETPKRDAVHVGARSENSVLFSLDNLQAMAARRVIANLPPTPRAEAEPQLGFQERALELAELESPLPPLPVLLPAEERDKRGAWFVPVMLCAGMALFWAVVTIAVVVNLREGGTVVVKTATPTPTVQQPVPKTPRAVALTAPSRRPERRPVVRERVIATPLSEAAAAPAAERKVKKRAKKRRSRRWYLRRRARRRAAQRRRRRARARRLARRRRASRVAEARRSVVQAAPTIPEQVADPDPAPKSTPSIDDLLDGAVTK